ncbi:MAG: hypothetical protein COB76_01415 [Alphaproteobacteria bacterium]|nr:MAG: hypothetical protein COB76_01415 [Alphaproteobacteria bacterium]
MKNKFNTIAENTAHAIAKAFGNEHRYIKQDGSGFHSGRLKSIFETPDFTAAAVVSVAALGLTMLKQGNLDIASAKMIECLFDISVGFALYYGFHIALSRPSEILPTHNEKAIDTTGTTLERAELNIMDIISLSHKQNTSQLLGLLSISVTAVFVTTLALSSIPVTMLAVSQSAVIAHELSAAYRIHMLLKGHLGDPKTDGKGYVFCDKPPAETARETRSVPLFGKTSPSP